MKKILAAFVFVAVMAGAAFADAEYTIKVGYT